VFLFTGGFEGEVTDTRDVRLAFRQQGELAAMMEGGGSEKSRLDRRRIYGNVYGGNGERAGSMLDVVLPAGCAGGEGVPFVDR
jgi:hypothetical protein